MSSNSQSSSSFLSLSPLLVKHLDSPSLNPNLSNNIFLVIGIHGLANKPLFLFQDSGDVKEVIWFAPLVVLLVMAVLRRFRQPRTAS